MILILRIQIKIIIERKQFKTNKRRDFRSIANFEEKKRKFSNKNKIITKRSSKKVRIIVEKI